jgi:hypothetical protein
MPGVVRGLEMKLLKGGIPCEVSHTWTHEIEPVRGVRPVKAGPVVDDAGEEIVLPFEVFSDEGDSLPIYSKFDDST